MPLVTILNNNNPNLNRTVEYSCQKETLGKVVKKYDPSVSKWSHRVAIGKDLIYDWDLNMGVCMLYGDSISIYRYKFLPQSNLMLINVILLNGQTIEIQVSEMNTVWDLKMIIEEKIGLPSDQQRIIFDGKGLLNEKQLSDYGVQNESIMHVFVPLACGGGYDFGFADVTKDGKIIKSSKSAPKWRMVQMGLCLEGYCKNPTCKAYLRLVIVNIGPQVCYQLGTSDKRESKCPMCHKFVNPVTCGFYNCKYRFLGTKQTENGAVKIKTEWKETGKNYFRFDENNKAQWANLVIETRRGLVPEDSQDYNLYYRYNYVKDTTSEVKCTICLNDQDNIMVTLHCGHKFHFPCIDQWYHHLKCCPICQESI